MPIGAYILLEPNTGCYYFGSSEDVEKRIARHYKDLRSGNHHCQPLQQIWNQHPHLEEMVYPTQDREEAYQLEQAFIQANSFNRDGMVNVGTGVRGGDNLSRNPRREQIIASITHSLRQRISSMNPEERKQTWGRPGEINPMFGKTHTAEVRLAVSEINKGNSYALGSTRSPEMRQRLSEIASERKGEKNPFFGKSHSEETKEKIRASKIGQGSPVNAMKVSVNGNVYDSIKKACEGESISYPTMVKRINSSHVKYANYFFVK